MSEAVQQVENESAEPKPQEGEEQNESKTFDAEYVDKLRKEAAKYRTEAKTNSEAAKRLAEIEEANKTEAQKNADRLAAAEQDAATARNEALRYKIATEFKLSNDDAAALEHVSSEEGMRLIAQRLAGNQTERSKNGNRVPREGRPTTPQSGDEDRRAFVRNLTGRD